MPKKIPITVKKRIRRRWEAQEKIEDMDDFGIDDMARSLDLKSFALEW